MLEEDVLNPSVSKKLAESRRVCDEMSVCDARGANPRRTHAPMHLDQWDAEMDAGKSPRSDPIG